MSWNDMYYGKSRPSMLRKLLVNGLMLNFILLFVGLIGVDFIPSDGWMSYGFYLCVGLAIFFSAWVYLGHYRGDLKSGRNTGPAVKIASFVALPFVLFGIFWFSVVYAMADFATRLLGEEKTVSEFVTTHSTESSGGSVSGSLLDLQGTATLLGFHVSAIEESRQQ